MSDLATVVSNLAAEISAARAGMDDMRRLPATLSARFRDAGLYRLCMPRAYGGLEATPRDIAATLEALAQWDASAAWCVMISATTGALAAYLPEAEAKAIVSDPSAVLAGVYAPTGSATVEGDFFRVTGQWKWNSNGQNATWLWGGCLLYENGAQRMLNDKLPDQRMVLFPASEATLVDTWRTGGLRGTGSGEMAVRDLLVPRSRSVSLITDAPRSNAPLYSFPIFGLLAMGIAAVASGNAKAALREFIALASTRRMPGGRTLGDRSTIQAAYADAYARLEAAHCLLGLEIDLAWTAARDGKAISLEQRARLRLAATHMTRTAAEVVRVAQDLAGGAGVFLSDTLQRRLADAQTMTAHIMTAPATYELTGRVLLGGRVSTAEI